MSFFQPSGNPKATQTTETTPSPASQGLSEFKAQLLGSVLGSMGGSRPNFSQFIHGGSATNPFPSGLNTDALLAAMSQPGAFTSSSTTTGESIPGTPSTLSDVISVAMLGGLLNSALGGAPGNAIMGGLGSIFGGLPGLSGLRAGQPLGSSDIPSKTAGQDTVSIGNGTSAVPFGGGISGMSGGDAAGLLNILMQGNAPQPGAGEGYGVLQDPTAGFNWGF